MQHPVRLLAVNKNDAIFCVVFSWYRPMKWHAGFSVQFSLTCLDYIRWLVLVSLFVLYLITCNMVSLLFPVCVMTSYWLIDAFCWQFDCSCCFLVLHSCKHMRLSCALNHLLTYLLTYVGNRPSQSDATTIVLGNFYFFSRLHRHYLQTLSI